MYRVTLINTVDNVSWTQLMGIDVGVTAVEVRNPIKGPGTAAEVLSARLF